MFLKMADGLEARVSMLPIDLPSRRGFEGTIEWRAEGSGWVLKAGDHPQPKSV
jgi:hypothetical protein